ncbi:hypothetical protein LCGC14_2457410 [marine sediment metagenome]|uniref:Uncharacterized protein n=1 Tax=marine sediment metagenome TaxID=412755 RepID=A0A0F9DRH5_9ZZZZ
MWLLGIHPPCVGLRQPSPLMEPCQEALCPLQARTHPSCHTRLFLLKIHFLYNSNPLLHPTIPAKVRLTKIINAIVFIIQPRSPFRKMILPTEPHLLFRSMLTVCRRRWVPRSPTVTNNRVAEAPVPRSLARFFYLLTGVR